MNIRKLIFFINDFFCGSNISKHLKSLRLDYSKDFDFEAQKTKIDAITNHAILNVPYYEKMGGMSFSEFPVVNKSLIRDSLNSFLVTNHNVEQLHRCITSGSTGTPFETFQDAIKRHRNSADTIFFSELVGFSLGEKLFYLKIWSGLNRKSFLTRWMQNIVPVDVLRLNDAEIRGLLKNLSSGSCNKHILGYASSLKAIAKFLVKDEIYKPKIKVRSIISMSESMDQKTRDIFFDRLNLLPYARYSNIENGIIAQQVPGSDGLYVINTASYYVEILELDCDAPVPEGQIGRIVITDLFNFAMPMIRYDTGDLGSIVLNNSAGFNRLCFKTIEGRKLDIIYDTSGNIVSSYLVYKNMWNYPEIVQYQIVQSAQKAYIFKINVDSQFSREAEMRDEFHQYLGTDASFQFVYVDEIPHLSSGKRRMIVNEWI